MKRNTLVTLWFALLFLVITSCVKEEYDFDKLDMKINVGGEMLSFPLGKTDSIKISTLLNVDELEILQKYEGAYALQVTDSLGYDISSHLPDLREKLTIQGKVFSEDFNFPIGSINMENFVVPAITEEESINPNFPDIDISKINIPEVENQTSIEPNISQYKPDDNQMTIDDRSVLLSKNPFNLSSSAIAALKTMPGDPISVSIPNAPISETEGTIDVNLEFPEGISNIDDIQIGEGAVIEITMELKNPILSEGSVNPSISFDPSDLFVLGEATPLILNKPLNAENSYKATYQYQISDLNIPMITSNSLDLEKTVTMVGSVALAGAKVSKANIDNINSMGISVKAEIKNIKIESVNMDFPTITGEFQHSIDTSFTFKLPEQLSRINEVYFKYISGISISITKTDMEKLTGVNVSGSLKLSFPNEFIVEGANSNNELIINDFSLLGTEAKKDIKIDILGIDLSNCIPNAEGEISLSTSIGYEFNYSIGGRVSSSDIPDNPSVNFNLSSYLVFDHAMVVVDDITQQITGVDFDFSMEVPSEVAGFGKITIEPQGDPTVSLAVNVPDLPLTYSFSGEGIKMYLPDIFVFKNVPSEYNFDEEENSITLQYPLPSVIALVIDRITAEAVQHGDRFFFESEMSIAGGITLNGGEVNTVELMNLEDKTIGVNVIVPEIRPNSIELQSLRFDLHEEMVIPVEIAGIDQLYSIDSILVDGANLSFNISLVDLPDLGNSAINVDFYVDLPDAFLFDDNRIDDNNVMHLVGAFSNNNYSIEPIVVRGIKFNGEPLGGVISLTDTVKVDGVITVDNPSVNIEDLSGDNVQVELDAAISTLSATEFFGKINYPMDPIVENISLTEVPAFLRSDDCVLDVENPHIAMTLVSNVGIPIDGSLTITPYINNEINTSGIQNILISIPRCEPNEETKVTNFWIGNNPELAPTGYVFIQSDLSALIRRIPDNIEIKLVANTDLDQQHYLNVDTYYEIEFNYDLVVPLMFGNDLQITLCDTIGNIPALISETLRSSDIILSGAIENSLPLQLELEVIALDANREIVPINSSKQTVASCNPDGSAKISDLNIDLSINDSSFNDIAYLILSFRVTSPNNSGIPITDDSFVRADLKALIKGGITLDLNDSNK